MAVKALLEQFGFKAVMANNGMKAFEIVQQCHERQPRHAFKLILMDFSMPVCDGPTSTAKIRTYFSDAGVDRRQQPKICLLSAYG